MFLFIVFHLRLVFLTILLFILLLRWCISSLNLLILLSAAFIHFDISRLPSYLLFSRFILLLRYLFIAFPLRIYVVYINGLDLLTLRRLLLDQLFLFKVIQLLGFQFRFFFPYRYVFRLVSILFI